MQGHPTEESSLEWLYTLTRSLTREPFGAKSIDASQVFLVYGADKYSTLNEQ